MKSTLFSANKNKQYLRLSVLLIILLSGWITHELLAKHYQQEQYNQQSKNMEVYSNTLNNALDRYDYLPPILSRNNSLFRQAFTDPVAASQQLESIRADVGADVIYIIAPDGQTIASSNWQQKDSFVGKNFSYRPYFKEAIAGGRGHFFGIGTTSGLPGYYVSSRYPLSGDIQAVIAIKVSLSALEFGWGTAGEAVFVSDGNGVIILTNEDDWRYQTLQPLTEAKLAAIYKQKQFSKQPLTPLTIQPDADKHRVSVAGNAYIRSVTEPGVMSWRLHYLTPYSRVTDQLWLFWSKALIFVLVGIALLLLMRMIKARAALRHSQGESSTLRDLNQSLEKEIVERKQIEAELRKAQVNLRRTSKLAAMGQLSAGITHELSQPLAAMRTYIASLGNNNAQGISNFSAEEQKNLHKLTSLVERMMTITQQLRYFARSGDKETRRIDLRSTIDGALNITQPAIEKAGIELTINKPGSPVEVLAGQVRLEQVLVNLIRNALDALQDNDAEENRQLTITLTTKDDHAILMVDDTGPGLSPEIQQTLFEPFSTTKPSGIGMGMGLAISGNIVAELEGTLRAENLPRRGARFIVTLPLLNNHRKKEKDATDTTADR